MSPRQPLEGVERVNYVPTAGTEPKTVEVMEVPTMPGVFLGKPTVKITNHDGSAPEPTSEA